MTTDMVEITPDGSRETRARGGDIDRSGKPPRWIQSNNFLGFTEIEAASNNVQSAKLYQGAIGGAGAGLMKNAETHSYNTADKIIHIESNGNTEDLAQSPKRDNNPVSKVA